MDSMMPSGTMSKIMGEIVHNNTTVSEGSVASLKPKYVTPHFIEGEVLTLRSNCETVRQMA